MATTIADIKTFMEANEAATSAFTKISKETGFPVGELLLAIGAESTLAEDFQSVFEPFLNEGGRAKGRAAAGASSNTPLKPTEAMLGEAFYERPNGEKYYSRPWGEHTDVLVLQKAREKMAFPLLYGAPGCGKTALVEAAFGEGLHTIMGTGDTEVSDLVGSWIQTPGGTFLWVDGPLVKAAEAGEVLLIDEIGLVDPKVLSIAYGAMDGRREIYVSANPERGVIKAADGFFVVAATNPNAPGVRLSEALLSRFSIHVEMTTDWTLAKKLGVADSVVSAAQNLQKQVVDNTLNWAPQFRELIAYRDLAQTFGHSFALRNLVAAAPPEARDQVMVIMQNSTGDVCPPARI